MKKLLIIIAVTVGLNTSIVAGPIHQWATNGNIEQIKLLINIGVSVEHKDKGGRTALHFSVGHNKIGVADYLISIGANVNAADNYGNTPIFGTHVAGLNLLINNGANVNHQNKEGTTPLMLTEDSQNASILINNGAKIDLKDIRGMTALHHASYYGAEVISMLLDHKADVNAKDRLGKTPLDHIDENYPMRFNISVFELLQQAGAKSGLVLLEQRVEQLSTGATTPPTNEWPRKMWEIDLGEQPDIGEFTVGLNNSILLHYGNDSYWVTQDGRSFKIKNQHINHSDLLYLDNKNLIYRDDIIIIMLSRNKELVAYNETILENIRFPMSQNNKNNTPIGVSQFRTKITAWDFTPPSSTAPKPDDGNGGGNETVNSRLIIKTAGPDIALATDGALGEAELQKSNDLRSWRKLSDVPKEASEVLVTPRESGNEFYRLKKN